MEHVTAQRWISQNEGGPLDLRVVETRKHPQYACLGVDGMTQCLCV